jgi:hypothetical protein
MGRKKSNLAGQKAIERRLRAGFGQGSGASYQPYIRVQDGSSRGDSHRPPGWKTGREHDLLSTLEFMYFMHLEWCPQVVDIQEQFPPTSRSHPPFRSQSVASTLSRHTMLSRQVNKRTGGFAPIDVGVIQLPSSMTHET